MRTLRFIVRAQGLSRDPACDFGGLVAGSAGYLKAYFALDAAWKGCAVAASFWREGKEYAVPVAGGECEIPAEALCGPVFAVSLTGRRGDAYRISTGRAYVRQEVI